MATQKEKYTDVLGNEQEVVFKAVDIGRHDKGTITLPEKLSEEEAVYWLSKKVTEQNQMVAVRERIPGFPTDVAWALGQAAIELFGFRELRGTGFWGEDPPKFINVATDHKGGTTEVFIGKFSIPNTKGDIATARDVNDALIVGGKLRRRDIPMLKELIAKTKEIIAERSLYKGKAFRVRMTVEFQGFTAKQTMADPEFWDVTQMPATIMLNDVTRQLLNAALWTPILQTAKVRRYKVPLRRGILLHGAYGTGKTLCAAQTAKYCAENGWTYIYVTDVRELREMYRFAARYAPAVLFAEDIDRMVVEQGEAGVGVLNNVLDGVDTKNAEVVTVLTTNHVDLIPQSLLRPGRFHTIVKFEKPNAETAINLVRQFAGVDLDEDNFDANLVGNRLQGNIPSAIGEVAQRAKLYAITRIPEDFEGDLKLTTLDLMLSAQSMDNHMELLNREMGKPLSFAELVAKAIGETGGEALVRASEKIMDRLIEGLAYLKDGGEIMDDDDRDTSKRRITAPDPALGNLERKAGG